MKKITIATTILGLLIASGPALAVPREHRALRLPTVTGGAHVVSLGQAHDRKSGKLVDGYAIIHYGKEFGHKDNHSRGRSGGSRSSSCYSLLAKGAKWKVVEPWVVNTANLAGLADGFVFDNLTADISKWEDAASADILGSGSVTTDALVADTSSPDGVNEVYFTDITESGAIAVTIVWGIFDGPPSQRELVEWDMVFDDVSFDWSAAGEAGKMDFENIATHEIGHAVGMGHPDDSCSEETMYRFAAFGETKKRDLNAGDIAGIAKLY